MVRARVAATRRSATPKMRFPNLIVQGRSMSAGEEGGKRCQKRNGLVELSLRGFG
jgi:hypothetical protein